LILADEPTGNLDSHSGSEILDLFDSLRRDRGVTLVVITHSNEVARRAERTINIRDGRIVSHDVSGGEHLQSHASAPVSLRST